MLLNLTFTCAIMIVWIYIDERQVIILTPKQEKFCAEYLYDLNATQAAIRAGYSKKTAYSMGQRLLKNVEIQAKIKESRNAYLDKAILTAKEVEYILSTAARGELEEEVVITVGIGDGESRAEVVKKKIGARDRIKAAELMGKRHNLFGKDTEVQVTPIIISGEGEIRE